MTFYKIITTVSFYFLFFPFKLPRAAFKQILKYYRYGFSYEASMNYDGLYFYYKL